MVCFTVNSTAATLSPEEIVLRFYKLLVQVPTPSPSEENDFFGGNDCDNVRSALLSKMRESSSQTPIWDYLRNHREVFATQNIEDFNKMALLVSSPFKLLRSWKNTRMDEAKVLVLFPTKRVAKSGYSGESVVVFTLGQKCYLDIGGTLVAGETKILFEKIYNDTR